MKSLISTTICSIKIWIFSNDCPMAPLTIAAARSSLTGFIDSYLAASQFVRAETDDQSDDLLTFEAEDLDGERDFRTELETVQSSLQNNMAVIFGDEESVMVDFSEFFNDPMHLRTYLPTIAHRSHDQ